MSTKNPISKERKFVILKRLLNGEHLSYQHLAQDYFVSRSSIANDIIYIKRLLAEDNVPLKYDNSGTYIDVKEISRQDVIKRVISENRSLSIQKIFIDLELYQNVKNAILFEERRRSLKIPEIYLKNIVLTSTILICRAQENHLIEFESPSDKTRILNLKNYPLANDLIQSIEKAKIYKFRKQELMFLSYIVIGSRINFSIKENMIPQNIQIAVTSLIDEVAKSLNSHYLIKDKRLKEDLLLHIYQMILRIKTHTTVINPLLENIKNNYPRTYGVVWYFLNNFGNEQGFRVSDDEIAFITIHFQAALERQKNVKKILFVCPHGIGTSSLAAAQLQNILPSNSIMETVSLMNLKNKNEKEISFIVSTVPLPKMTIPIVKISPLLTIQDMKNVMNQYIEVTMNRSLAVKTENLDKNVKKLLNKHILLSDLINKEELLDNLTNFNYWSNEKERQTYLKTIKQRENLQSTYIGNGIAIPHGNPKKLTHSSIAIAILKEPIKWGNNKVKVVCLLMINDKDKGLVEPFMNLVMKGLNNRDEFVKNLLEFK